MAKALFAAGCGGGHSGQASGRSRAQLIGLLGVMRRAQTGADRNPAALSSIGRGLSAMARYGSKLDVPLIRFVGVAPWGARLYLVPFTAATSEPHCTGTERTCEHVPELETVTVLGTGYPNLFTAATIKRGYALAGPLTNGHVALVVPDGVVRVAFLWRRSDPVTGAVTYPRALSRTAPVHGNVAAVQAPRNEEIGRMTWYGPHGRILKRFS